MNDHALLTTARWLHQRDANAKTVVWATALVLFMATLMCVIVGAIFGGFLGHTLAGVVVGCLIPVGHTVRVLVGRWWRHREAVRMLRDTDPELISTVAEWNAAVVAEGERYEIRTPRKIQTLHVLRRGELTVTHLDYPEWHPAGAAEVEALVRKARPC